MTPWKEAFVRKFGSVVQGGPFAGMTFHARDLSTVYLPLLTGSYEAEIHGFIETALARGPKVIADVGCEDGFVAVGLALRAPQAKVYAYDILSIPRAQCRELAAINKVEDRVIVGGECTPETLNEICNGRSLIFSDCESYELELLDPDKVPALKNADIIVELHDFMRTDVAITPTVLARFEATHDITVTGLKRRSADDFPSLAMLPKDVRAQALHEDRVEYQQWAYLKAKNW